MLQPGATAPEFDAPTHDGRRLSLASLRGHPVVLYFYPRAKTPGCSQEARRFAALYPELHARGVDVVGVSVDPASRQREFAEECDVPFALVSDQDKAIAREYGVLGLLGLARRVTFFLDADGRVVETVEAMMPGRHIRAARERFLSPSERPARP